MLLMRRRHAGEQSVGHHLERDAPGGVGLGVEEDLGVDHAVGRRAIEIGARQIAEILFGDEHRRALVVDVQEVLQARKRIGGAQGRDIVEGNGQPVSPGQREHHLRLEAALDMHMQLGLRQPGDERVGAVSNKVSLLCTDQFPGYTDLNQRFFHRWVDHGREQYVVGAVHTQTMAGFWSLVKRGMVGTMTVSERQLRRADMGHKVHRHDWLRLI